MALIDYLPPKNHAPAIIPPTTGSRIQLKIPMIRLANDRMLVGSGALSGEGGSSELEMPGINRRWYSGWPFDIASR